MKNPGTRHFFKAIDPKELANLRGPHNKQLGLTSAHLSLATISRAERGFSLIEREANGGKVEQKNEFQHPVGYLNGADGSTRNLTRSQKTPLPTTS